MYSTTIECFCCQLDLLIHVRVGIKNFYTYICDTPTQKTHNPTYFNFFHIKTVPFRFYPLECPLHFHTYHLLLHLTFAFYHKDTAAVDLSSTQCCHSATLTARRYFLKRQPPRYSFQRITALTKLPNLTELNLRLPA